MKVFFDRADMLYIQFADGPSAESEEVVPGIVLDFDGNNTVVGIEIEDASKVIDLSKIELVALPLTHVAEAKPS